MKNRFIAALLVLVIVLFSGCAKQVNTNNSSVSIESSDTQTSISSSQQSSKISSSSSEISSQKPLTDEDKAEQILADMTLEEKIGQMFFLTFRGGDDTDKLLELDDSAIKQIESIQPGGVVLFGENIDTVEQIRSFIDTVQAESNLSPFISIDQEGGVVQRIKKTSKINATNIPQMFDIGKTGDTDLAKQVGNVIGTELSVFGFNMDFAPDCDVFSNPKNTVIGHRAFSDDPNIVADMSIALSEGIKQSGLIPVCKHFPGHGDTVSDTHIGFAVSNKTLDELYETELIPFKTQIENGADMIMVAHISLPEINGDKTPATLSSNIVTDLLRDDLGFGGVAITDSMSMGAITENYSTSDATVMAVKAGIDMILMPNDPIKAYNSLIEAVKNNEISEERINESVLRILKLKYKYNLFEKDITADESLLGCDEHKQIINSID